jgi:hypothetical protein
VIRQAGTEVPGVVVILDKSELVAVFKEAVDVLSESFVFLLIG